MADPVIPGGIRTIFTMPGRTGLPEDRYITTWAFRTVDNLVPTAANLADANNLVAGFYAVMTPPALTTIANYLAPCIDLPNCYASSYKLGDLPPRQPFTTVHNLGAVAQATGLPSEVSICASFFAGINLPRRRGRVYVGPMTTGIMESNGVDGISRPKPLIQTAITTSMKRLQSDAIAVNLRWCVLSQADANLKDITAGWCDNAFDTQRRRGEDASSRLLWSSF
jgi:hypothetical protein